ncbi:unnamed protein product [Mytilus edulis]|uniref:B box-type domain-containing protein n=1 Tax=Mytilus edulis TaxID=6550 RepID=A0A8S3SSK2_MYTED|nr:unnamed protein product [Mytilus edulis]
MIAIEDYLKIQDVSVDLTCKTHGKKLDLFCKYHSVAICAVCVPSAHKTCQADDIISIADAAENANSSSGLTELEKTISRTLENIKHCIKNRLSTSAKIDTDEQMIKTTILQTKLKLIKHLDVVEEKLLLELRTKHDNYKAKHSKVLEKLKQKEKDFEKLEEQMQQMKLFASDLQVFLGTCQMNKITMEKIELLKTEIGKEQNYKTEMKLNSVVSSLMNEVKQFGEIHITETNTDLKFKDVLIDQAQIQVHVSMRNIHDVNHQLKLKFDIRTQGPNHRMSYNVGWTNFYTVYHRHRKLEKSKAFDITEINTDRIAVTYPNWNCIEIFNIKEITVESKIGCKSRCYGISHYNGNIFTIVQDHGILMMDLSGTILQTINIDIHSSVYFITVTDDKLYYTDERKDTVNCCNLVGKQIWVFENKNLVCPSGITVDNNQNVYVSGLKSYNLTLIQHDGKQSKEICNACDDLCAPLAVCYNKTNNSLLLGYKTSYMALYQVSQERFFKDLHIRVV